MIHKLIPVLALASCVAVPSAHPTTLVLHGVTGFVASTPEEMRAYATHNLIVTPHIAWASRQAQQKLADEVVANLAAYQRGERRNRVV